VTPRTWQNGYEFFQRNLFYQQSDESVDERNRLLLITERHNKKDNLDFPLIVSKLLRISYLKAYTYIYIYIYIQGGSNMTGTDLYVNKPHCAAAVRP